jgi:hypothetical protein
LAEFLAYVSEEELKKNFFFFPSLLPGEIEAMSLVSHHSGELQILMIEFT